jgi:hypothetical protein
VSKAFAVRPDSKAPSNGLRIHVSGTGTDGVFSGTFHLQNFVTRNGALAVTGRLSGMVTTDAGETTSIVCRITRPAVVGDTSCETLQLDFGPLHLDLLGLQIDLSRIVLDITVQAEARSLLGNLLCAVVFLLNDPAGLAGLLNSVLAAL